MRRSFLRLLLIGVTIIGSSACTFEPGTGFATVRSAFLRASFEAGAARDLGDDTVLTNLGYHVELESLLLGVTSLELQELQGASNGGGGTFDPANPPPSYSLCHSGHCHHDDGRLVSYEDIQAEMAGGVASFVSILSLPVDEELDLLDGGAFELSTFEPSRELPQSTIGQVSLGLSSLRLAATITEGGGEYSLGDEEVAFTADLGVTSSLTVTANQAIDRDGAQSIELELEMRADGTLFDTQEFSTLASDGELDLTDEEAPAALLLVSLLFESELLVTF